MQAIVIDDSRIFRDRVFIALSELAIFGTILLATGPAEANALLKSTKFDFVVLDLHMPDADGIYRTSGLDVLKAIKSESNPSHVIVMSNFSEAPYRTRCQRLGADGFLDKSTEFMQLQDVTRSLLAGHTPFAGDSA